MNQDQKREYTARVAQANRSELVVIIYELFLLAIDDAKAMFKEGRDFCRNSWEAWIRDMRLLRN